MSTKKTKHLRLVHSAPKHDPREVSFGVFHRKGKYQYVVFLLDQPGGKQRKGVRTARVYASYVLEQGRTVRMRTDKVTEVTGEDFALACALHWPRDWYPCERTRDLARRMHSKRTIELELHRLADHTDALMASITAGNEEWDRSGDIEKSHTAAQAAFAALDPTGELRAHRNIGTEAFGRMFDLEEEAIRCMDEQRKALN